MKFFLAIDWSFYGKVVNLIGSRYVVFAGLAFILTYVVFKKKIAYKKIQPKFPKNTDYLREIFYSIITIALFGLVPLFFIKTDSIRVHTFYYTDINQYGTIYFISAFIIMLFLHDSYFYWMHRLMHHTKIFKYVHLIHHKSTNPSPWAAYAFHPLEAIIETGIVVIFLFIMPIHTYHLPFFFLFMIVYNVYGHLGWELYPIWFATHPIGKWINTSVNHNQHHQYFKGNYGLYFLFWDRWMGTIRDDYEQQFVSVKERTSSK